ncbi:3',5'-cyclic AMP phosphodiesterase CpdA [Bacillus pakistanensis]|uniref:3',5'-cyclic AMP phosphodiesterase CpdA n=1 Tax=Rossellomorea pakistanensis TaxID=992288 RepID=A0ABS2N710_9BACI|nr:metallophosphoesterase [Bacillus pakistanensis]MBM7583604.1 3',5'-cyclic AMP phosphodiesterase CpdA [Bacillus pakistanensis]
MIKRFISFILLVVMALVYPSTMIKAEEISNGNSDKKPILTFPVISDVQLTVDNERVQKLFHDTLNDLHSINPNSDALIINGDMINDGKKESYQKFLEILNEYPHPEKTYYTIGNHEFFKNDGNEASIQRFLDFTGYDKVYYKKMIKGYPFFFLGSESWGPVGSPTKDSAFLSEEQLKWLEHSLKIHSHSKKPMFVFLHQPLPNTFYGTDIDYYKNAVIQDQELKAILAKYPSTIFISGHMHWDLRFPNMFIQDDFTMVSSGGVDRIWGPDGNGYETIIDSTGSQGLYIEVYKNRVEIKGRNFAKKEWIKEYQHTVYNLE